jgi:hypothetical protein
LLLGKPGGLVPRGVRSTVESLPVCGLASGSQKAQGAMSGRPEQATDWRTNGVLSGRIDGVPDCMRCVRPPRQNPVLEC